MNGATNDPPRHSPIGSRAELEAALLALLGRARHRLRLADDDLSVFELGEIHLVAALRALLVSHRGSRIELLVDDLTWLDSRAPRLRRLQRDFSHALLIRCTDPVDPVGAGALAIGDDLDALTLRPARTIRGELWCGQRGHARQLIETFDRRWELAAHDQPSRPLGL